MGRRPKLDDFSTHDQDEGDMMYRRLKNRERQRRYRERKRLKADINSACMINQPLQWQFETPPNDIVEHIVRRTHCKRDWKKDARTVHLAKQQVVSSNLLVSGESVANQALYLTYEKIDDSNQRSKVPSNSSCIDDREKFRCKSGQRNWKAEARKKK